MTSDERIKERFNHLSSLVTRHGSRLPLVSTLLIAALAAAPLFLNPGFLITRSVGDTPNLLFRVQQLLTALSDGQRLARWMPDGDFGYGYPYFNYYASLPTYIAALFKLYGFSFTLALKLTQFSALAVAALGLYAWARSARPRASAAQAWLASAAYTFAPFHLVNLYVRGDSLGELWAMAFYPLCLWSAQRWITHPSLRRAFSLAACVTLLILSHNISALNFLPFLGLYLVLQERKKETEARSQESETANPQSAIHNQQSSTLHSPPFTFHLPLSSVLRLPSSVFPLLWGLLLSAFFWLPALLELKYVQVTDLTQGFFFYGNHFRGLDLIQPTLFFNPDPTPGRPTPFSMGLLQTIATLAGLLVLGWRTVRSRQWSSLNSFILLGLGLSTFMITPLSAWLWEHLPLIRYTQFPWRFLSIQALFTAMLIAQLAPSESKESEAGIQKPEVNNPPLSTPRSDPPPSIFILHPSSFILSLLLALSTLGHLRLDFIPLTDAEVTAPRLNLYEYFTGSIGNTVNNEYLPRWVTPRPFTSDEFLGRPPRLKALNGQAQGTRQWKHGAAEQWTIQALTGPTTVAVPTHYWPGWIAEVDGQRAEIRPAESLGWISFDLQPGEHSVKLQLEDTPVRTLAAILSLFAVILPLAYAVYRRGRHRPEARPRSGLSSSILRPSSFVFRPSSFALRPLSVLRHPSSVFLILIFLILHALPPPPTSTLPLSMDFNQLAYLHHDLIRFEGGTQLTRVDYSADHLARGDDLIIHTEWNIAEPSQVTLSLTPPSNLVSPIPVMLTTATAPLAAQINFTLTIPTHIPPGVYFIILNLQDASGPLPALTSSGRARGTLHLAPIWIDDPGLKAPAASLADFGAIQLMGASTDLNTSSANNLRLHLLWRALADVPRNYQLSLRLRDLAGTEWTASDSQIAYGFYPTSLWRPREIIPDFYTLPLPPGTPPGAYTLALALYDVSASVHLGEAQIAVNITDTTPIGDRTPQFQLTPEIAIAKVEYPSKITQGDAPEISVSWLTVSAPSTSYRARWTLTAPGGVRTTQTLDPAPGSPTHTWPADSYILGRVRLGTSPSLTPGFYQLSLTLIDEHDQPVGSEVILGQIEVTGRPREFSVPALQTEVGATFGDKLKLWGYDVEQNNAELKLKLVWGALTPPGADYKFFVHLFNAADEFIAAQVDAMPHNFDYPTALWVADEVVTDTLTFSLAGLEPGTYRLAVGWYDPNTLNRLSAFDAQGQPLEFNRVILPLNVEVPSK